MPTVQNISKVKLANGTVANVKDATARADLATLIATLKTAAYKDATTNISDGDGKIADAATVKAYVDSQVGSINKFDIVVAGSAAAKIPAGAIYKNGETSVTGTLAASADSMYKLYLVENDTSGAGTYVEWITVRSGAEGSYTYTWEAIGNTSADLADYVKKTVTIAGVDLQDSITVSELQTALGLGALAYAATASGSTTLETIDSITMDSVTVAGNATVTTTSTNATLTKADYTPAGTIKVDGYAQATNNKVIKGGTISVAVKDAASATEATLTRGDYTPAGTIAIAADNNGAFQVGGTNAASAVTFTGGTTASVLGSVKDAAVAPSFTDNKIGTFVAPELQSGFYSAGTAPSFTQGAKASLTAATTSTFATSGITAAMGTNNTSTGGEDESEILIFSAASTSSAVTDRGTFTENGDDTWSAGTMTTIDTSKFSAGSWTAGTFNAGSAATFNTATVVDNIGTGEAAAQTFTGNKYTPAFTGTKETDLKVTKAEYLKQVVDTDNTKFTGTEAEITFAGTEADDVLVTAVAYDKADSTAAFSETVTPATKTLTKSAKTITITASPDVSGS